MPMASECFGAVLPAKMRRDSLDAAIVGLASEPPFAEIVGRLSCCAVSRH